MIFNDSQSDSKKIDEVESQKQISNPGILTQTVFPLLEERLVVNLTQRKAGEIVVRKEIETNIITVNLPVRNEKIIVEQVSPKYKKIAEVSLGESTSLTQDVQDKARSEILQFVSNKDVFVIE